MRTLRDVACKAMALIAISSLCIAWLRRAEAVDLGQLRFEQLSPRRSLLATYTESKCLWDSTTSVCRLNPDYVTTLSAPTTDSGKLVARAQAQLGACSINKGNEAGCKAYKYCTYSAETTSCSVNNSYIAPGPIKGITACPGSLAEQMLACVPVTAHDSCIANSACTWNSTSVQSTARAFFAVVAPWMGWLAGGLCTPKWGSNATLITELLNTATNLTSSGSPNVIASILRVITGTCSGPTSFLNLFTGCGNATSRAGCFGIPGCSWSGTNCDVDSGFVVDLLAGPSDPWVSNFRQAVVSCAALANSTACGAAGTITADTTVQASYITLQSAYTVDGSGSGGGGTGGSGGGSGGGGGGGGAAGRALLSPLLVSSLLAGLACMWWAVML